MHWVLLVLFSKKSPWSFCYPSGKAEMRWAGVAGGRGNSWAQCGPASPTSPIGTKKLLGGLWKPSHAVMESLEVRHQPQQGLFRVYPSPIIKPFTLLPAIPLFLYIFFIPPLFSCTIEEISLSSPDQRLALIFPGKAGSVDMLSSPQKIIAFLCRWCFSIFFLPGSGMLSRDAHPWLMRHRGWAGVIPSWPCM